MSTRHGRAPRRAPTITRPVGLSPAMRAQHALYVALRQIGDDPVALVAEEPELHTRRLEHAVMSVSEAAETALEDLARVLLNADTV